VKGATLEQARLPRPGTITLRQLAALFRMELIALARNPSASVIAVAIPLVVGIVRASRFEGGPVGGVAQMPLALAIAMVLGAHHHLITVYAARRQELVLKRLRAGLPSDLTILAGAASGTVAIFLAQALVIAGYGVVVLDLPVPANPLVLALGVLLAVALVAAASAALSAVTRSSEAAMMTSVPTMVGFLMVPGLLIPRRSLPAGWEVAAGYLPLGQFPKIIRNGWLGVNDAGGDVGFLGGLADAAAPLGVLAGWLLIMTVAVRIFFRWEPRHG
jgi:ABC-2 type transport system permease protein